MIQVGINALFLIPGEVGGSETYVREILRVVAGRYPDIRWTLFTNRENHALFHEEFAEAADVRLWPVPVSARSRPSRVIREQLQLPRIARRAGIHVLWSPGYTAPVRAWCPQVVSVLDMQYREFPEDLSRVALWMTRLLVPAAVRVARKVITLSDFGRDQIVKYTGVSASKVVPIHLAVNPDFRRGIPPDECRARLEKLMCGRPYILCVANTYPHKNIHTLVAAYNQLPGEWSGDLVLVGSPRRGEPRVQDELRKLDARKRVVRLGGLERRDLIALYQGASVFAFPSLYEGFGLPLLEAMAAGIPVVATRRGPMEEVGGDAVRYCDGSAEDLARQLASVLTLDKTQRDQLVARARARSDGFTWQKTADKTVEIFRSVVNRLDQG